MPKFNKIKAVLFDIDGTMTDSDPIHFIAYAPSSLLQLELGSGGRLLGQGRS